MKPMLAKELKDISAVRYPVMVQPKLDGMRAIWHEGELRTRNEKLIESVPSLIDFLTRECDGLSLDGELYSHDMGFNEIMSICRRSKNVLPRKSIQYHVFDIPDVYQKNFERQKTLHEYEERRIPISSYLTIVPAKTVNNREELEIAYRKYLEQGYEGIILRNPQGCYEFRRTKSLLKYKPFLDGEFPCVGFVRGQGKYKDTLGAITIHTPGGNVEVGSGFSDYQRDIVWNNQGKFVGTKATVKFQEYTESGKLRFPTFKSWRD